jgi:hypothetical protein
MARYADDPPYQLSRAALRNKFGARAITSSGQSPLDTTPSGRSKYLQESRGISDEMAKEKVATEFQKNFRDQAIVNEPQPAQAAPLLTRQSRRHPFEGGVASPSDVGLLRSQGASGTVRTPYGTVTLGLLPETEPAEQMTGFLPTASPLTGFGLPSRKPTYLGSPLPQRFNRYG